MFDYHREVASLLMKELNQAVAAVLMKELNQAAVLETSRQVKSEKTMKVESNLTIYR